MSEVSNTPVFKSPVIRDLKFYTSFQRSHINSVDETISLIFVRREHMLNKCQEYPDLLQQNRDNFTDFKILEKYRYTIIFPLL